jgi:hypothetical protein
MKTKLLLLPLFALLLWSCDPNDDGGGTSVTDAQFAENFGPTASRDFIGQVVDRDNQAVVGATVTIGSSTAQTDVHGVFAIEDANVHQKFAYIKVTKPGYFDGSRSLVPMAGKNNVKIMLIPATPIATIASGSTADVEFSNGTKVTFDGAFEDENGVTYTGNVSVSMFHLEASDDNISSLMPGMLYAKGDDGNPKVLNTFGMLNVELRGSAGQKLNIAEGHTAEIAMKIDNSQLATAPNSIPLWHFDEAVGYWKQDGTATKQGGYYIGEVSHFSWWNCDAFESVVYLTVTVQDAVGNPMPNVGIQLVTAANFTSSIQITGNTGQVDGAIPAGQELTLNVYDVCGNIAHTETVGPFTADTNAITVQLTQSATETVLVTGTIVDCDGQPVTSGYVLASSGNNNWVVPIENGVVSYNVLMCSGNSQTVDLIAYDILSGQGTGSTSVILTAPTTDFGVVSTCDLMDEFVSFQVGSMPIQVLTEDILALFDSAGHALVIFADIEPSGYAFTLTGDQNTPGTYTSPEFISNGYKNNIGFVLGDNSPDAQYNLQTVGSNVGDFINMSITGTYNGPNGPQNVSVIVHVRRDN